MRKRKYTQLDERTQHTDMLLEDIDEYHSMQKKRRHNEVCPALYIHNLVGTAMVESSSGVLDLQVLASMIPNCCYAKQKFAAITIRLHSPCCTALLFTSGKMVLTGCKSYLECVDCALQVVRLMREHMRSTECILYSVKVQNMVGNVILNFSSGFELRLDDMHRENNIYCTYQKKMFPGLIYRPDHSPIVLLLFQSGKIVVTGGKSVHDMQQGWIQLWPFVLNYIKNTTPHLSISGRESRLPLPTPLRAAQTPEEAPVEAIGTADETAAQCPVRDTARVRVPASSDTSVASTGTVF